MSNTTRKIVVDELEALKVRMVNNIITNRQNASGRTIESLQVRETESSVALWGRSPFGTMETGRKKGNVPKGFQGIILQWMKDKGIKATPINYVRTATDKWKPKYTPQERGDLSLAGAISHKIKTEGTQLHREGGKDWVYSKEIPVTLKNIQERLKGQFLEEVLNVIKINQDGNNNSAG